MQFNSCFIAIHKYIQVLISKVHKFNNSVIHWLVYTTNICRARNFGFRKMEIHGRGSRHSYTGCLLWAKLPKTGQTRLGRNFANSFILHKNNVCEKDFGDSKIFFTISMSFLPYRQSRELDTTGYSLHSLYYSQFP